MEERKLSEQESLALITQMINTAKQEQKDNGAGWIWWGWLLFSASILSYVNIHTGWFHQYFFWNVFGFLTLAALVFTLVRSLFIKKATKVKTYTSDLFQKLNIGFFIFLMLIIVAINVGVGPLKGFALLGGLYGFWILIYGTIFDFRPSIVGAFVTWACAFAGLFVNEFQYTMLLQGAGVLAGYIIPGHMAMNEFNKIRRK
jgi:membrane protein CcdC involved in cytochrome C biogenesis